VLVTRRVRPLRLGGRTVHQIGLPYHWGGRGLSTGDTVNELIPFVADPNVSIQESKALTGNIEPGRRSRQRRVVTSGPISPQPGGAENRRDLTEAAPGPVGGHGLKAARQQETEEG
jgi:formate dehydrogenase major subunit